MISIKLLFIVIWLTVCMTCEIHIQSLSIADFYVYSISLLFHQIIWFYHHLDFRKYKQTYTRFFDTKFWFCSPILFVECADILLMLCRCDIMNVDMLGMRQIASWITELGWTYALLLNKRQPQAVKWPGNYDW